ncbi:Replication initiation protein [Klebsiella pneumoniae]|nr:Replication initiation protein [Klebsiella pneumoniae]
MTDLLQNHYSQVKNPNPVFTPREGKKTLPLCRKLMAKAEGFTSRSRAALDYQYGHRVSPGHRVQKRQPVDHPRHSGAEVSDRAGADHLSDGI